MICPKCGSDNPEGAKFCGFCNSSMAQAAPRPPVEAAPIAVTKPQSSGLVWKVLSVVLVAVLVVSNVAWFFVKSSGDDDLAQANDRIDGLEGEYASLEEQMSALEDANELLQQQYDELLEDLSKLGPEFELYQRLRMESLAADYYQTIRENVGPQSITWQYYDPSWQNEVDFCAQLTMHDEGRYSWGQYEALYYEGYHTYSYDDALAKLQFVLEYANVTSAMTPVEKIDLILQFIYGYVEYQSDMIDKFFAPVETLFYRTGDCDDFGMLAAALFEVAGVDSALGFFSDASQTSGHVMVLVHLSDLGQHTYTSYSDLTSLGLDPGKWIVIEPQSLITEQYGDWFSQWILEVAAET